MPRPGPHRIVRINYPIRAGAFAFSALVIGLHGWGQGFGPLFWVLLALQFLMYPHLVYLRARASVDSKAAEQTNVCIDSVLLGAWVAGLGFPTWIFYGALFSTTLNSTILRGIRGGALSFAGFGAGAALAIAMLGFTYAPQTSFTVTVLCFGGALLYTSWVGLVVHRQNRSVLVSRADLNRSEERYRAIAENAADLIALVDHDGRWIYASPSYSGILDEKDLAPGADAFHRAHPDDADRARAAVIRAASTGTARSLTLRMVDKEGRIRQYKTRVQPVSGDTHDARKAIVLVSQDVTDLRDSEERLLLAAHALEGMTEAIIITAADGTVLTVNRAFCAITGHSRDEVLGRPEKEIRNALQPAEFYDEVYTVVHREGYWSGSTWSRRKNGAVYREWRSVRTVRNTAGAVSHYVIVFSEVGGAQGRAEDAHLA